MGSLDYPIDPVRMALAAGGTFVARSTDKDRGLTDVLTRAAAHRGTSFCEIYQNCNIDNVLYLEHGKPMVFGKDVKKGLRMVGMRPEVVTLGEGGVTEDDLLFHDETNATLAMMLSNLHHPEFPEPLGVFYVEDRPCYEDQATRTRWSEAGSGRVAE